MPSHKINKPIIRWTIGNASKEGIDCLKFSVKNIVRIYKKEFDYFICFNKINKDKIKWAKDYNIKLVNQEEYKKSLDTEPIDHPCWKLYPPRLNIESYEIFIDNDLVIDRRLDFNIFIKNNYFFISEAIKQSYGTMQKTIIKKPYLNSGLFGIPPGFDFREEINSTIKKFNIKWTNSHFEEQAIVAYILIKNSCKIISLKEIYVCYDEIKESNFGFHFVGLNSGNKKFKDLWKKYRTKI